MAAHIGEKNEDRDSFLPCVTEQQSQGRQQVRRITTAVCDP
jgi:hypothetical protein